MQGIGCPKCDARCITQDFGVDGKLRRGAWLLQPQQHESEAERRARRGGPAGACSARAGGREMVSLRERRRLASKSARL
jgi:hypothetical protein